ncbi:MAG: hypothetical protein SGJ21_12755 [Alphaproteobacteria bacterium]|nr:hypothetical protein [Alphaproteobacteria bacterium]
MPEITFKQANRRYRRMFWPVIGVYTAICFAGPLYLKTLAEPPQWLVAGVALASAAPLVLVFWLMSRLLRETDEYTRAMQTQAMLAGGGATLSFAGVWGFLELFEVVPHLWPFLLVPMFFFAYGAVYCARRLRAGSGAAR